MSKPVRILWRVFFAGLACFILIILLANWGVFGHMPSISELENPSASLATEVLAVDGTVMGKYYVQDRSNVDFKDISPNAVHALIATEDERFYEHSGIDSRRLVGAILSFGRGGGASTITQQLALNLFNGERAKNRIRRTIQKLQEWIIAVKLERNFTKNEILALYLNTVPFGDNIYGIRNASRTFFQKEPANLSVEEAALLIGLLKGNSLYNPRRNPTAAFNRRNTVIGQLVRNHYLTAGEAAELKQKPIVLNYKKMDENNGIAPYFRDVLRDELKTWCKTHTKANGAPYDLYRDGLKIYTTINSRMQIAAEEAVAQHLSALQKAFFQLPAIKKGTIWKGHENILENAMKQSDRWRNMKDDEISEEDIRKSFDVRVPMKIFAWNPKRETDTVLTPMDSIKYCKEIIQSSFLVADPITGEIRAWVGGVNFKTFKFDHVNINTKRQVGSTFKPLLYTYAVENGYTPDTPLPDGPINLGGKIITGTGGPMAVCLAYSKNPGAAYLMNQFGVQPIIHFAEECGIESKLPPYPSIALGAGDISLIEMIRSYTMFAGYGVNVKPVYISRIEDRNGNILQTYVPERKQVISEAAAYTMINMMEGVVNYGTGRRIRGMGINAEIGAKTGTTNDNTDAWFIGYTPQLLAGAWVGCDDPFLKMSGDGARIALPVWAYFFQKIFSDNSLGINANAKFTIPESLKNDPSFQYQNYSSQYGNQPDAEIPVNGNGTSEDYQQMTPVKPTNEYIGPESQKLSDDDKKALKEALKDNKTGKNDTSDEKKKNFWQKINPFKKKD